jgi:hypothetical protein
MGSAASINKEKERRLSYSRGKNNQRRKSQSDGSKVRRKSFFNEAPKSENSLDEAAEKELEGEVSMTMKTRRILVHAIEVISDFHLNDTKDHDHRKLMHQFTIICRSFL